MNKYKDYLGDLGLLIKEIALSSKNKCASSDSSENRQFEIGYLMGLHRVISLMQQQAEGFNIPLEDMNLEDIDPDEDLF